MHLESWETWRDEEVWQLFKAGNRNVLTYLYRSHYRALFLYGRKLCPATEMVEDCIQDLFVYLWNSRDRLSEVKVIRMYLIQGLRRRILEQLGKAKHSHLPLPDSEAIPFDFEISMEDVLISESETEDSQQQLNKAITGLTERQKEAIYLKFYQSLSYEQIGLVMDLNLQSTRTLIYRAIKILREFLLKNQALLALLLIFN